MRTAQLLALLPAVAVAQQQIPLLDQVNPYIDQVKGWFNKATPSITSAISAAVSSISIPNPAASAAAKIAELKVVPITLDTWKTTLHPGAATASPGIESWLIFVTGGNKTCYGLCKHSEEVWNQSVAIISAGTRNPPNLGLLDCEKEPVLCHSWATLPPQLLHMQLPQPLPDQSTPSSTVRSIPINRTSISTDDISNLILKDKYLDTKPYESIFQPFDGLFAKTGLQLPVGYITYYFSLIPSWVFMIGISMLSRTFMGRTSAARQTQGAVAQAGGNAGGARPAAT